MLARLIDFIKSMFFGINVVGSYAYDHEHGIIVMTYTHRSFFTNVEKKRKAVPMTYGTEHQTEPYPVAALAETLLSTTSGTFGDRTKFLSRGLCWEDISSLKKVFFKHDQVALSRYLYARTLIELTLNFLNDKIVAQHLPEDISKQLSDNYDKATVLVSRISDLSKAITSKATADTYDTLSAMYLLSLTKRPNQDRSKRESYLNIRCNVDNECQHKTFVSAEIENARVPVKVAYTISMVYHSIEFDNINPSKSDYETNMMQLIWLLATVDDVFFALLDYEKKCECSA